MSRLAVIALTAALSLAACGGEDAVYSSDDVVDLFRERTGELLVVSEPQASFPWERLDFGETATADDGSLSAEGLRLAERFGAFTIYVIKEGEDYDAEYAGLTAESDSDETDETVEGTDDNGVLWVRTCYSGSLADVPCAYSAVKRYGENVVLRWQAGEERDTDATFDRLNTVLRGLGDEG